jgi:hypothetical protein
MRRRRVSLLGMVVAGLTLLVPHQASAELFKQPEVDGAVQVTSDTGAARGHVTPALATDPNDTQTLVIAEGDAYSSRCMVHVSRNGGLTWSPATQPQTPPDWPGCGFAVTGVIADLAFAPDGTLYYAFSAFQPSTYQQRIYLARSTDLGLTWETTALPRIGPDPAKREFGADAMPSIVVDREDPNNVYVAWWSNNGTWNLPGTISGAESSVWCRLVDNRIIARPWIAVSTDRGRSFGPPVDMAPGIDHCTTEPYITQGKDGEILAFFGQSTRTTEAGKAPPAHLFFSVSRDRGKTFTARPIHEQSGPADGPAATSTSDWLGAPSPGVDLETGTIYVAWEDLGAGVPRILFKRSTDGGRTWSEPVKVNDADGKRDFDFVEQFPTLSVAENGRIDVVWYDYRNDPVFKEGDRRNGFQDVYYASSANGGRTWSKNVRVNDRGIDRRFGPRRQGSINGPLGLVSTDKVVFVAWDDTRNGNEANAAEDIYFTRIRYAPPAEAFGGETGGGTSAWVAGLLGAAVALAIGGLIIVIGMLAGRRGKPPTSPPATPKPAAEPLVT